MAIQNRILSVDDSRTSQNIIAKLVREKYGLYQAYSGKECLDMIISCQPDLILLDVEMPELDGYETCEKLRELSYTEHIPILFLSSHCSVEEKVKGYQAGGDDYITKPFDGDEVMAKIKKNLAHKEDKDRLSQEAKTAAEVALIAMGDSSYMGLCIQFLEKTYVTDNINDLARLLLQTTQNYGLNCSVQIRYDGVAVNMELDGMQRELESSLLTKMHTKGRYLEFANRAIINFPHISLLIKNMPVEDENKHGLFRDQLMILLQSTESRIGALVSEMQVKKQRAILEKMIGRTKDMLSTTDVRFVKLMTEGAQLIDSFVTQLDDKSKEMGLTELQEEELGAIGSECLQKSALLFSSVLKLDSQFGRIVDDLKAILGNEL